MKINPVGKRLTITDEKIGNRKNIILLGDCLEDAQMINQLSRKNLNVISIGFLNNPKDYKEEYCSFSDVYDIVVVNDGGWQGAYEVLKRITDL